MDNMIEVKNLTKDYGGGKGIFDVSFDLKKGEILGFVGANGAGKTTTIRHIMGFLKQDSGNAKVKGMDAWKDAQEIKKYIGYVPGEIAFPDLKTGTEFLKSQAEFLGVKSLDYANSLAEKLQLDPSANLKRMSKGMKQKTAIIAALMADPEIIILDEPTTGLDPLMRLAFIDILQQEKQKGKTILISSHLYEELEKIADRVMLIDKGKVVTIANLDDVKNRDVLDYKIEFYNTADYKDFCKLGYNITRVQDEFNQATVSIQKSNLQNLFRDLKMFDVKFITEVKYTLEKHFSNIIKENKND